MAITKIHAVKVRLGDAINYIENPDKTDGQELISGYNTAPQTAVLDFSVTAAMARKARNTSAKRQGNLAYHLIQSFSPDDAVTPERAHELGRKLAMEFTDGKFEFVVATHINKDSIHMQQRLIICRCAAPINLFGWSMRLNHLPRRIPSTSKMKPPCRRIAERLHNLIKWGFHWVLNLKR